MTAMQDVFTDLAAEGDELYDVVAELSGDDWKAPTPATGWTVAHQLAHLAFITGLAKLSTTDPEAFEVEAAPSRTDFQGTVDTRLAEYLADPPAQVLRRWQDNRTAAQQGLAAAGRDTKVPWLSNPLPASVLAAGIMMELFAHGQDVRDALGRPRTYTDRIGHIAFFGTRTRDFGYLARGLRPPAEEFRFELTAPSGIPWNFGPADAEQKVSGPAADFCLLVTRRRHRDDLALTATGDQADHWLDIAQAYPGPAGEGRRPARLASA